jgi:hypothetical protein
MKLRILVLIALPSLCPPIHAQTLIDSFGGTSVNSANWQVITPFADSSVVEGGGDVTLTNRGMLLSQNPFGPIITITGQFEITGSIHDQFAITLDTTGSITNPHGAFDNGIQFQVISQFDNGSTSNNVNINAISDDIQTISIVNATMPINIGQVYDFKVTDDGFNTAFYVGNLETPILTMSLDQSGFGDLVGFNNREGADGGSLDSAGSVTELSNVEISSVPEPATFGLLFGLIGLVTTTVLKRRK